MLKKIVPILFFCFLTVALSAQKKRPSGKVVQKVRQVVSVVPAKIPSSRMIRLGQWVEAKKSLVVLKNSSALLPLERLDTLNVLVVSIGLGDNATFSKLVSRYSKVDQLTIDPKGKPVSIRQLLPKPLKYNLVVFAIGELEADLKSPETKISRVDELSIASPRPSIQEEEKLLTGDFASGTKTIFLLFGSQQFLSHWSAAENCCSLVVADKADCDHLDLAAQLIFGAIPANGRLSFDLNNYKKGEGISIPAIDRLSYVLPEEVGIDSTRLSEKMDSLVHIGLRERAFPGCQLLLAKDGKVIYQKSYGFHTYNQSLAVQNDDIYDLASVTKVLAPVPALMILADQRKFVVTKKMSDYWPDWKGSNKEGVLVSDLLTHQARLRAGVVLWPNTLDAQGRYKPGYYSAQPAPGYDLRVSDGLYLIDSYPDTVYKIIRDSPLLKTKKYAYSDLGFVILPKVIENLSGESFEMFLRQKLYARLGASSLMYRPGLTESKAKIVPTEDDRNFRHELLQGFVHDETAALLGGISGNAGLFGSVGDVAKVMQLYLQEGHYGNERFIKEETLKTWTSSHNQKNNNRRGYGFDKPGLQTHKGTARERYPSAAVSELSYGHSGFTGTFVWADPVNRLLFVFLSNRVYPDRDNHKINKLGLRPLLLDTFFKLAGAPSKGR